MIANSTADSEVDYSQVWNAVRSIDLSLIRKNLIQKRNWSVGKAEDVEDLYRKFLFLCVKYPEQIVPDDDLDKFWEMHILDSKKYRQDCLTCLGVFLHHTPNYLERNPAVTSDDLYDRFLTTKRIFGYEFGGGLEHATISECPDCAPEHDDHDGPPEPEPDGMITGLH